MFAQCSWLIAAILILRASAPALAETPTKSSSIPALTFAQAKSVVDKALLDVALNVGEDNKTVYHVIVHNDIGPQVFRFSITSNDTVLAAIAGIDGLPAKCMKRKIWLARPTSGKKSDYQNLPVNWKAITEYGSSATNYTLRPGDQIHVAPGKPPAKPATPAEHIIEPPDILYLDGSKALRDLTRGIIGDHLVREDGTISLGAYGHLMVTGLTLSQAQSAIKNRLSSWLKNPDISLRMENVNSLVYYVIMRNSPICNSNSEQVIRIPMTSNETVLDAIARIKGLPATCSKRKIWVVRPTPTKEDRHEILPVEWRDITEQGSSATNYTLRPGDQIHIGPGKPEPPPIRIHSYGIIQLQRGTVSPATPPQ